MLLPSYLRVQLAHFDRGLRRTNHEEGRDFSIKERWAQGSNARLPGLVADLVQRQVSVIVTTITPGALAAKTATKTIRVALACRTIRSEWCQPPWPPGRRDSLFVGFPGMLLLPHLSASARPPRPVCEFVRPPAYSGFLLPHNRIL